MARPKADGNPVKPTEAAMKQALQAYIDAFNRVDVEGIIALYADNATVEDPVGSEVKAGKQKIAEFYRMAIKSGAKLKLAAPIRASHGNSAAMAFDVELNMPQGRAVIRVIDVMSFDEQGKFASMRAYWGPSDMELLKA
jgi:steroid Delta-isomerase